ncbi:MAG: formate dehydrogenase accessory protein FdhE [Acidilobus sp.]
MAEEGDELDRFERALRRYSRLLGLKIDLDLARKVEAIQERIKRDVAKFMEAKGGLLSSLSDLLARLSDAGLLSAYIVEVGSEIGDEVNPSSAEESLAKAFEGDVDAKGARSALLAFQAIARAYAEAYERANGIIESTTPYCPLCGSESRTMVRVGQDMLMVCHVCGYAWRISKGVLTCPFCGNSNPFTVGVFTDKDRRLGLAYCQQCGSTWRVIFDDDMASAPRILLPLLALAAERLRGALPAGREGSDEVKDSPGEGDLGYGDNEAKGEQ